MSILIGNSLTTSGPSLRMTQPAELGKFAGLQQLYPDLATLMTQVAAERTNITGATPMWNVGQRFSVGAEPVGVGRSWFIGASAALSHANTVTLRHGLNIVLPADTNTVLATAGAPGAVGNPGDVAVDYANNAWYVKGTLAGNVVTAGAAWGAAAAVFPTGASAPPNAPVTITANNALTHAAHFNRQVIISDAAATTQTLNNDATNGAVAGDYLEIDNKGAGTVIVAAGTGTLNVGTGFTASVAPNTVGTFVYTGASTWISATPSPSAGGVLPPLTLTASTNITRAAHVNRTILIDAVTATMTIQPTSTELWADGDTLDFIATNPALSYVIVTDTLGYILPVYNPQINSVGGKVKLRFRAATGRWYVDSMPIFYGSGTYAKTTMAVLYGSSTQLNINLNGGSTDFNMGNGKLWWQTGNAGYNGSPADCAIWLQSTVSRAPTTPQVAGGYGNGSRAWMKVEQAYYEAGVNPSVSLSATPLSNIDARFPGSTRTGEQLRMEMVGHGLIIGSVSNNAYNGEWGEFDTNGNLLWKRAWGNQSRQKDVATGGNTQVLDNVTNLILAGSGTILLLFPINAVDGQILTLILRTAYTSIGLNPGAAGRTINGVAINAAAPMSFTAGSTSSWRFDVTDNTWDRVA